MNTLIIGGSGKIGRYFNKKKQYRTYRKKKIQNGIYFDLTKHKISKIIKKFNINKVVFLSAISDTDFCFKNSNVSHFVNCTKTKSVLKELIKLNIYIIFFSTEFVFSGNKGNYKENDNTNPINVYGKQKLVIENFLKKNYKNFCILRIAKTYSIEFGDKTIITSFLNDLKNKKNTFVAASDQIFSPLYINDLTKVVNHFLKKEIKGIYNLGGPKKYSRYAIYKKIIKYAKNYLPNNYKPNVIKTSLDKIKFIEKRPKNVSLNNKKLISNINFKLTLIDTIIKKLVKKYENRIS